MSILTTRCVVLQTHSYGDTSKIMRLLTRDLGPRSAIARGALRPRSRISGVTEPFAEGFATLYIKENRDLHTLSSFELIRERQELGRDLRRFAAASVLCELVLRLAPVEPDPGLFETLVAGLDRLLISEPERVRAEGLCLIWSLVGYLGFRPTLDECVGCGRTLASSEKVRFDALAGGLRCAACGVAGYPLTLAQRSDLATLAHGTQGVGQAAAGDPLQVQILSEFIQIHPADGLRIRSLDFLGDRFEAPRR